MKGIGIAEPSGAAEWGECGSNPQGVSNSGLEPLCVCRLRDRPAAGSYISYGAAGWQAISDRSGWHSGHHLAIALATCICSISVARCYWRAAN